MLNSIHPQVRVRSFLSHVERNIPKIDMEFSIYLSAAFNTSQDYLEDLSGNRVHDWQLVPTLPKLLDNGAVASGLGDNRTYGSPDNVQVGDMYVGLAALREHILTPKSKIEVKYCRKIHNLLAELVCSPCTSWRYHEHQLSWYDNRPIPYFVLRFCIYGHLHGSKWEKKCNNYLFNYREKFIQQRIRYQKICDEKEVESYGYQDYKEEQLSLIGNEGHWSGHKKRKEALMKEKEKRTTLLANSLYDQLLQL